MKFRRLLSICFSAVLVIGVSFSMITCGGDDGGGGALTVEKVEEEIAAGKTAAELLVEYDVTADMDDAARSAVGELALSESDPTSALTCFGAVTTTDSVLYGEAQYGILMARFQQFGAQVADSLGLLDMVSGMSSSSVTPQQGDIWESMIVSMGGIDQMLEIMGAIQTQAQSVVSNGYTITLDDFPFVIGADGEAVYVDVSVSGENGELAARTLWMVADLAIAGINYLGAHAWDMNLSTMMGHLTELTDLAGGTAGADMIGLLRSFAWLPQENPNFFSKSTRWSANMATINSTVGSGASNIKELDSAIADTAVSSSSACDKSVCLVDVDSSGTISAGDQLYVNGAIHVKLGSTLFDMAGGLDSTTISQLNAVAAELDDYGIDMTADSTGLAIDINLTSSAVMTTTAMLTNMLAGALPALETLLDIVVDSLAGTDEVEAADINPVLTALGLPTVPNVLSLDLSKFMDMPIGDLMGYYCVDGAGAPVTCGTGTTPVFPIEVEMADVAAQCAGATSICGTGSPADYYMEGDNAHFAGTDFAFDADGLVPVAGTGDLPTDTLIYVAMPDPTINGALMLDLTTLPAICGGTETASGFSAATLQGGNIVINCLILDYLPKLEASSFYTDVVPILTPFVSMLGF